MKRRHFFKTGTIAAAGTALLNPFGSAARTLAEPEFRNRKAKNIIFMVSDGMSSGTLSMADLLLSRKTGKGSNWMQLYKDSRVQRSLMETISASSIVTDSSAGSSAWGGGVRVPNGSLNVGANGEKYLPILQKFKRSGKMVGCVTTVPITHATPAGFCVNSASRNGQPDIAEQYLELGFDVMMGGGNQYFSPSKRKDKKDMYAAFKAKDWQVATTRSEMNSATNSKKLLGVFADDALPYSVDRASDSKLQDSIPTLAEMAQKAIDHMKGSKNGFAMQIEGGKIDWGAHANDVAAMLYDQAAFDEAIGVVMEFAAKDKETLVIITTDHGNSNPGIIYGDKANDNFDSIQHYRQSNEWILNNIHGDSTVAQVRETIHYANGTTISDEDAKTVLSYYDGLHKEEGGLYNYKKLPYRAFSEMQKKTNSVGWISMDHSGDYVELCAFGPGSEMLKPWVKNTDLHYLMLTAAEVENKF
ncbi:MAG: alkaline phosphatase [Flavobacterium sp.]|nr:MAG: alkaline phosphatase [Flavobacterium sp.]